MAQSLRDLRQKMRAIGSTKQVTKAMEMIAASKMRRAVQNAKALRRYALTALNILERIASLPAASHPFLEVTSPRRTLALLFTSDRGMCGPLNAQMFRLTQQYAQRMQALPEHQKLDFIAIGLKGQQFLARTGRNVVAAFPALSNKPKYGDVRPISRIATEAFTRGEYDNVVLLYPTCVTAMSQEPTIKVLLPLSRTDLHTMIEDMVPQKQRETEAFETMPLSTEFRFEPSPEKILESIVPKLTEMQVYQAVLESAASEHSARMMAMRNATDNASSLLDDLTLEYNLTRQASITAELSELTASKMAMEE